MRTTKDVLHNLRTYEAEFAKEGERLRKQNKDGLLQMILQAYYLATTFESALTVAQIRMAHDPQALSCLTSLLQDENQPGEPGHKVLLLQSAQLLGVSAQQLLATKPTEPTLRLQQWMHRELAQSDATDPYFMAAIMTAFEWGVGMQYGLVYLPIMARLYPEIPPQALRFYFEHAVHDSDLKEGHPAMFLQWFSDRITTEEECSQFMRGLEKGAFARIKFLEQFMS